MIHAGGDYKRTGSYLLSLTALWTVQPGASTWWTTLLRSRVFPLAAVHFGHQIYVYICVPNYRSFTEPFLFCSSVSSCVLLSDAFDITPQLGTPVVSGPTETRLLAALLSGSVVVVDTRLL